MFLQNGEKYVILQTEISNKMGIIAQQSIRGAVANYLGIAIGFLTTFFVLTRCLTEEEVGLTRMMVDAAMLFSSLAQLGTNSSLVRYFPYFNDKQHNHGIFGWSILVPAIGFTLMLVLFFIFHDPLVALYSQHSPLAADYFYLLPMLTFMAMYVTVFETNASVLMHITVPKMIREIGIRVINLIAYIIYGLGWVNFDVFMWIFCSSYGLAMLLNLFYLFKLGRISLRIERGFPDKKMLKEMGGYSLFMTATVLASNIPLMNSLFLGAKAGAALTGVYAIASYIANVVDVPYRSLGAIARPVISAAVKENNRSEVNRLIKQVSLHQFLVSLLIFYVIWINIDMLFAILPEGERYASGAIVVLLLGLAKVVNSTLSISTDVLNFSRYYRVGFIFIAVLTATAILLNNSLISFWSIGGSAAATLIAYSVYFALILIFIWNKMKVSPLSAAMLKVVVMIAALWAGAKAWQLFVSPIIGNMIVDACIKTILMAAIAALVIYFWRISPTINEIVDKNLARWRK